MLARSSSNLIVESFTILRRRNRRRSKQIVEPELRTIVETTVATMADTRTMSELLQAPTEGYEDAIVIPAILAEDFELKVGLLQLVTSSQFHSFERDDPHAHIRCFNKITSMLKYKNVPHDAFKLMLFPFSLEGAAHIWLEKEPPRSIHAWEGLNFDETFSEAWDRLKDLLRKCPHHGFLKLHQIDTFYNALTQSDQDSLNAAASGNLLNRTPRDALTIIENKSKVRTLRNKPVVSKVNTSPSSSSPSLDIIALTDIVKELVLMNKANQQATVKAIEETCVTCGGQHPYYECLAVDINTFNASTATGTYNQGGNGYCPQADLNYRASNQMGSPKAKSLRSRSLPSNTIVNLRGDVKAITTRSSISYDGPTIPPTSSLLLKEVKHEPEATKDKMQTTSSGNTTHVYALVVQVPIPEPNVALKPNPKPFMNALLHIPKFASTFKSLFSNKEKLFELVNTPLTENCSTILLKKLPKKLGDPWRFLIPCGFQGIESCMALADLGSRINLMPLFVWKKLSLSDLTPTRMTLKLASWSYTYPAGIANDVFVQVGKFTFPTDFVIVDYDVNPRVPLILGRPFLRMARDLVDVHGKELILRNGNEKLIFYADSTSKHPHKHGNESINMINFIDITGKDRFPKVLKFKRSNHPLSGSTTPLSNSSPGLTPFETSDSLFDEFVDELALLDPFPLGNEDENFNFEADFRKIEYLVNQDPSTESDIEIIDLILEKFTDEPAFDYSPPPRDEDDDLFNLKSGNDEWKKLFLNPFVEIPYGESRVHIEVLSVLWGNRLPIRMVRGRCLGHASKPKEFYWLRNVEALQGLKWMIRRLLEIKGLD
nr:reverse transcriptase domain-containing protein [Tanacetum cinerariifolium]